MSAVWQKNEPTAAKRRCLLIITDDGGMPANPGHNFVAGGAVFVVGAAAPNATLATGTLTNVRRPLVVDDFTFTAAATDICTKVAHGLQTGDGPLFASTTGTLPGGLAAATGYYAIKIDANNFYLATSAANAYAGTRIDIIDAGTGTHTIADSAATQRGVWGHFVYEAAQTETNHDNPETLVFVDGTVASTSYLRMNGGGALTTVDMSPELTTYWDKIAEGSYTFGDLLRGVARTHMAKFTVAGSDITYRNLTDTKNSHRGTVTALGRTSSTIDDLT